MNEISTWALAKAILLAWIMIIVILVVVGLLSIFVLPSISSGCFSLVRKMQGKGKKKEPTTT